MIGTQVIITVEVPCHAPSSSRRSCCRKKLYDHPASWDLKERGCCIGGMARNRDILMGVEPAENEFLEELSRSCSEC